MGNTTVKIVDMPDGKNHVILIVVSVGTQYFEKESFEPLACALAAKVDKGELSADTPCVIWRTDVQQRHTLEYRDIDVKAGHPFLTEAQALALAIYNGDKWENDCRFALNKLRTKFKTFRIIRTEPIANSDDLQNLNFIINSLGTSLTFTLPGAAGPLTLPAYEIKDSKTYEEEVGKFNEKLKENQTLAVKFEDAVDTYYTAYTSFHAKNTFANQFTALTQNLRDSIKNQSRKYIKEDVINLNKIICQLLKEFDNKNICFIYPFPHGNATESATLQVISIYMELELFARIHFPQVHIHHAHPAANPAASKQAVNALNKQNTITTRLPAEGGVDAPELNSESREGSDEEKNKEGKNSVVRKQKRSPESPRGTASAGNSPESTSPPKEVNPPVTKNSEHKKHALKASKRTTGFATDKDRSDVSGEGAAQASIQGEVSAPVTQIHLSALLKHFVLKPPATTPPVVTNSAVMMDAELNKFTDNLATTAFAVLTSVSQQFAHYDEATLDVISLTTTLKYALLREQQKQSQAINNTTAAVPAAALPSNATAQTGGVERKCVSDLEKPTLNETRPTGAGSMM